MEGPVAEPPVVPQRVDEPQGSVGVAARATGGRAWSPGRTSRDRPPSAGGGDLAADAGALQPGTPIEFRLVVGPDTRVRRSLAVHPTPEPRDALPVTRIHRRPEIQRYHYLVPEEGRRIIDYTDDYDPAGAPNLTHLGGPVRGAEATYESNEAVPASYGEHIAEWGELVAVARSLIELLIRRADMAIAANRESYMIGVIETADEATEAVEQALTSLVFAHSGPVVQAFEEELRLLAGELGRKYDRISHVAELPERTATNSIPNVKLVGEEGTGKAAPMPPVELAARPVPAAASSPAVTRERSSPPAAVPAAAGADEPIRKNLKNCAAKKLILAVPAKPRHRMSEVLYDPLGKRPVMVGTVRYHHRQRVPSCEDCQENLPHLHKAMREVSAAVTKASRAAAAEHRAPAAELTGVPAAARPTGPASEFTKPLEWDKRPAKGDWLAALADNRPKAVAALPAAALERARAATIKSSSVVLTKGDLNWPYEISKLTSRLVPLCRQEKTASDAEELTRELREIRSRFEEAEEPHNDQAAATLLRGEATMLLGRLTARVDKLAPLRAEPQLHGGVKPSAFVDNDPTWCDAVFRADVEINVKVTVDANGRCTIDRPDGFSTMLLNSVDEQDCPTVERVVPQVVAAMRWDLGSVAGGDKVSVRFRKLNGVKPVKAAKPAKPKATTPPMAEKEKK